MPLPSTWSRRYDAVRTVTAASEWKRPAVSRSQPRNSADSAGPVQVTARAQGRRRICPQAASIVADGSRALPRTDRKDN